MIARLLGHPRWRARTRAGELLEAFGLAEAAGRSGRTRAVCADGWPGRDPELVFLDAASPCPPSRPPRSPPVTLGLVGASHGELGGVAVTMSTYRAPSGER